MEIPQMGKRVNDRRHKEDFMEGHHLKLEELKVAAKKGNVQNNYLFKDNILDYPQPEFHVSHLKHDANLPGLMGIREKEGFRNPKAGSLLWFSLVVGPEEIQAAARRLLGTRYPDRAEEQIQSQQSFLEKFATSPAFKTSSRYGSYRFTFSVEEVLEAYKDQFCHGAEPVMRVMETVLYKQEVVYVVLVHSPANQQKFSKYPLLPENPDPSIVIYNNGHFVWKSEAMCETHWYELVEDDANKTMEALPVSAAHRRAEFYVWDHAAIALDVGNQVLKFDVNNLREKLTFCEKGEAVLNRYNPFQDLETARREVAKLWPDYPSPLKEDKETTTGVSSEGQHPAEATAALF